MINEVHGTQLHQFIVNSQIRDIYCHILWRDFEVNIYLPLLVSETVSKFLQSDLFLRTVCEGNVQIWPS